MGKSRNIKYKFLIISFVIFYTLNIIPVNFAPQILQQTFKENAIKANDDSTETKEKVVSNINNQLKKVKDQELQGDIYLKYNSKEQLTKIENILSNKGISIKGSYQLNDELKDGYQRGIIKVENKARVKAAVKYLNNLTSIAYAEPNYKYKITYTPTDSDYKYQWPLELMNAPAAWDITKGSRNITIAILDTGIDFTHPELSGHILSNGYDFVNKDKYPGDDNGHGTMVAGVIGAKMDGKGIVGVAGGTRLLPIKVLDRDGSGYTQNISKGIIYAVNNGAKIINLSLAGPYYSQGVKDAISYAHSKGRVVVAASGNSGRYMTTYPAANPYVIAVGATDSNDQLASFSNYGSYIDVTAPGEDIYTTAPLYRTVLNQRGYAIVDGTSFAAPQVSALAALLLSVFPNLSPNQVEGMIDGGVKDIGPKGKDIYYGYGRINLYRSIVDRYEPNYSLDKGVSVPIGQAIKANFVPAGDIDYYKYYVKKGYKLSFSIISPTGANIVVKVYNNQRSLIKTVNRYGDGRAETDSVIQSEDGYIYLRISDYNNRLIRLKYTLKTSKQDIYENNNTKETAYLIKSLPKEFNAQVSGKYDVDWYKFVLNKGGELKVNLSNYRKADGWQVGLFNKDKVNMPRREVGTDFTGISTFKVDNSGTYYIKLYNNNGEDIIKDYSLGINYAEKDNYEPNDNISNIVSNSSLEVNLNQTIIGNFHTNGDIDYYYFQSHGLGVFNFNLQFPLGLQPYVEVYRVNDLATPIYSNYSLNEYLSDQINVNQEGYYIVLIKPYNNNYTSSYNYIFTGNFTPN